MLDAHSLLPLWLIEWTTATRCCDGTSTAVKRRLQMALKLTESD